MSEQDKLRREAKAKFRNLDPTKEPWAAYMQGCDDESEFTVRNHQTMITVMMHSQCQWKKCHRRARSVMIIGNFNASMPGTKMQTDTKVAFLCKPHAAKSAHAFAAAGRAEGGEVDIEKMPAGEN